MNPSHCFSSSSIRRVGGGAEALPRLHRQHFRHLGRYDKLLQLKPQPSNSKSTFLPILRFGCTVKPVIPYASLSSFAEASDGEEGEVVVDNKQEDVKSVDKPGIAQAFHISSRTATAIIICISFTALSVPLVMNSMGQGLGLKNKILSYITLLFGFYMAWNIGANDVANAMGTSVGSGALSLRQAVLTAAVLEFSGALLMGTHVTSTMQKGILRANVFQGMDSVLFTGLLSSLAAAGTWLQVQFFISYGLVCCLIGMPFVPVSKIRKQRLC